MMLLEVALLIVTLSHDGYWIGGEEATVRVQWAVEPAPAEAATFAWQLGWRDTKLAEGHSEIADDGIPTKISITPPTVRVRTRLTLTWQLLDDEDNVLDRGDADVHLFPAPASRLGLLKAALDEQRIVVLDDASGLPRLLERAEVEHQRVDNLSELIPARVDVLLVGQDQLVDEDAATHAVLWRVAQLGNSVIVFAQPRATRLLRVPTPSRLPPPVLAYRADEPLFATLTHSDIASWLAAESEPWRAVRLDPERAAGYLALWPPLPRFADEQGKPKRIDRAIDATVIHLPVGKGKALLWQIPLGDWRDDPRSAAVLANALDWALGPTPALPPPPNPHQPAVWRYAGDERLDDAGEHSDEPN